MKKIIYKIQKRLMRSCSNNIDYSTLKKMVKDNKSTIIIDVRTKDEYITNHISGAINIPLQNITQEIENVVKNQNTTIIIYCQYGGRSNKACNKLEKMGYSNIYNLYGGIEGI